MPKLTRSLLFILLLAAVPSVKPYSKNDPVAMLIPFGLASIMLVFLLGMSSVGGLIYYRGAHLKESPVAKINDLESKPVQTEIQVDSPAPRIEREI